jgi:lipopolysaccharide export LptBFGC system permease protein LptF
MMRLPWTIWRYASAELWRLVLLSSTVTVTVIAFAATVKPLADGKLGAMEALRFLVLAILPMSEYALPFASGFGATLAYHRLASDNELSAARVSGVSHVALLMPATAAGVVLSVVLSLLAGQVVPRFLRAMEEIITQDVAHMIVNTIDRGECMVLDDIQVYADRVDRLGAGEDGSGAERLLLTRVAAVQLGAGGRVAVEVTARRATAWLDRVEPGSSGDPGYTRMTLRLEECWVNQAGSAYAYADSLLVSKALPGVLRDDVKFLTDDELRGLRGNPDSLNVIGSRRRNLAYHVARVETLESIRSELTTQRRVRFSDAAGRSFVVRASGLRVEGDDWVLTPLGRGEEARVEVEIRRGETDAEPSLTMLSVAEARLRADLGRDINSRQLVLSLSLSEIAARGEGGSTAAGLATRTFTGLSPQVNPLTGLLDLSSAALLTESRARLASRPDENIQNAVTDLTKRLERLWREVTARKHERAAMALSVLVMVLTGSVTAIRLKGSLPLNVYLWSFFPGLLAVITVNAGQESARSIGWPGLVMLWGGVAALAAYGCVAYLSIRRH